MIEERILLERARDGDQSAFEILVEQYKQTVYNLAYDLCLDRKDAEDATQEVFIKAYRSLANFKGNAMLKTWLYRITVNHLLNLRQSKHFRRRFLHDRLEDYQHTQASAANPHYDTEITDLHHHIKLALKKLSLKERTVFMLRYYHDLPVKEIAGNLRLTQGTVKSMLHRGVQKVQQYLAPIQQELDPGDRK
jgi:RNA polymerase sigma-70 factor (ECF subfamily)